VCTHARAHAHTHTHTYTHTHAYLQRIVEKFPEMTKMKDNVSKHINILHHLSRVIDQVCVCVCVCVSLSVCVCVSLSVGGWVLGAYM